MNKYISTSLNILKSLTDEPQSLKAIARKMKVHCSFIYQITDKLKKANLITITHNHDPRGSTKRCPHAHLITVLDVYRVFGKGPRTKGLMTESNDFAGHIKKLERLYLNSLRLDDFVEDIPEVKKPEPIPEELPPWLQPTNRSRRH